MDGEQPSCPTARRERGVAGTGAGIPVVGRGRCFCTLRCLLESQRGSAGAVTVRDHLVFTVTLLPSRTGTDQQDLGKTA